MATIEAQLALEERMLQKTAERYNSQVSKDIKAGRGAETQPGRKLMKLLVDDCVDLLLELIEERTTSRGRPSKYLALVRRIDPTYGISVAMQAMMNAAFDGDYSMQNCFIDVGTRVEDEIKFTKFKQEHPDYYDTVINDFKTKGTTNYRHMHRVLTNKMHEFEVEWNGWSPVERAKVGEVICDVVLKGTPLFELHKPTKSAMYFIRFTEYASQWIKDFNEAQQYMRPLGAPCIIPPADWESINHGGFYSPEMQSKHPFVRSRFRHKLKTADLTRHMTAVNRLQKTAWMINPRTAHFLQWALETNNTTKLHLPSSQPYTFPDSPVKDIPKDEMTEKQKEDWTAWRRETAKLHSMERKRFGAALGVWRVYSMVEEYQQYEQFYFVYTTDFRGRIYPVTSGLSPQGADYSKGMLQFKEGKRLGEDGVYWLKVSVANLYGYDKCDYDERVRYVDEELRPRILRAASSPCTSATVSFIGDADKPLQFLAACFEYAGAERDGPDHVSHLPVGLDGSCNGLQNFSALLRDPVGGLATNVLPSDSPRDIYGEVARVAVAILNSIDGDDYDTARKLLRFGIDRSGTKRSVMTLPYGLTKHSSRGYVGDWLREKHGHKLPTFPEFNAAQCVMNDAVWDAIGKVVKAAREGMDWLQDVAAVVSKSGKAIHYTTPTGFVVHQERNKSDRKRLTSVVNGIQYIVKQYTDKIDVRAMKNGSAPNFIHSLDASHLVLTVLESSGITSWQMVHDDFGTHACDIPELHRAIRVAFVSMYLDVDLLDKFRREIQSQVDVELPPPPMLGDMDITQVLASEYFFG